jgi:crotonobetainyl-CoA:carnitine CoA-transferase CaiB-like acyl-CoA transferase
VTDRDPIGSLDRVVVRGPAQVVPSTFPVTTVASDVIAAATVAVAEYAGFAGDISIDTRHAATAVRSERHLHVVGQDPSPLWDPVAGDYRTADGWIRLHTNYPHHRTAALGVLGAPEEREAVATAVGTWSGDALEAAIVTTGGAAAVMRTEEEWRRHEHGRHLIGTPPLTIERIADGPPLDAPLPGLRVLDLTRVIAGPVASRFLAGWGADVLRVEAPGFSDGRTLTIDVGIGKRSCGLDLRETADRAAFERLAAGADVVVHGYRPGALRGLGYSDDRLAALRPGVVIASLSAYGPVGPWTGRRGFDSLVQMSSGIAAAGASAAGAGEPVPLPCQLLDHGTGYLLALGILRARRRQREEGGAWAVRASLARTAAWLSDMERVDAVDVPEPTADDVAPWLETSATPWGDAVHVRPPGAIGDRTPRYPRPPSRPRSDPPEW